MTNPTEEIRERWAKATPGPWHEDESLVCQGFGVASAERLVAECGSWGDNEAIAAAPDDIATLLAEVDRLRAENAERKEYATKMAASIDAFIYIEGRNPILPDEGDLDGYVRSLQQQHNELTESWMPRRLSAWHEDDGEVLWWKFPVEEPPYVGSPLDEDFPEYVTHWTPVPRAYEPFPDEVDAKEGE